MEDNKQESESTMDISTAVSADLADIVDVPDECTERVVAEMAAMRKAYVAHSKCASNHRRNILAKRRNADKNARKMRKMQHKHRR